ncbi:hypothetical protein ACJMK2_031751 [Sinanodonta woodiana]|uniref:Fibronectin type-III domain-containing protein n=1 Tax=Sinanodonta woodiana TaxID=1069815 RepID=A0ABD3X1U7_SINWO
MTSQCTEFIFMCVFLWTRTEFLSSELICPTQLCSCFDNILIDCPNKKLKTIPKFTPSNTTFFKIDFFEDPRYMMFYKNQNDISTLDLESFKNITVEQIDLRSVRLTHIDSKAFAGLEQFLKMLYIEGDGRPVENLPFLKGLMTLELLHLENFGLTDVRDDNLLKELNSLKTIIVKGCINLTSLGNNTFVNMHRLSTIFLENLPSLQKVPNAIQDVQSLTTLKIYNTSISYLDQNSFKGLTKLKFLNLTKNYLQFFEHNTFAVFHRTLEYLDLSLNKFSGSALSLLATIKWMNLRTLNISQNLMNLPEGFFYNMSTLRVMILNQCNLSIIENTTFKGLGNLISLELSRNEIEDVDVGSFLPTPNLTHLDLHDQHHVRSCQLLHSSGYPPLNLPHEAFRHLQFYLTHLDLGYNILNLTDTFEMLRILTNLKKLDLSCIGLEEIPSYLFRNHSSLQNLFLKNNNLKKLSPLTLYGLSGSLIQLYLTNNKLKTLYKCVLENFTHLQTLQLDDNEWICDCHFRWVYDSIKFETVIEKYVQCTTPEVNEGKYVSDLSRSDLKCNDDYFHSDCPIWLDLIITTLSQTSLQLTWSVSEKYLLSGYLLEVTNIQNTTSTIFKFQVDNTHYKLTKLEPGTPYQICLLIVISETVKANLEVCKTWIIQGPSSSEERHQEETSSKTTSRSIIFKFFIVVGAVGFIIIVLAITLILKTVSKRNTDITMQLVLTEQCTSGCTTEAAFSKSSGSLDSFDGHFLKYNNNMLSIYPETNLVEQEKLRERCKHLVSTSCENDVQITSSEFLRSDDDICSPNMSETERPLTMSSIIYTEVDTSLTPSSEIEDNNDETINSLLIHTAVPQETEIGCQTPDVYSEINEPTMDHDINDKGSKSDVSILKKTESITGEATLTSIPVQLVSSRQKSFNVNKNVPASKKKEKKTKTKVGGLNTWGRNNICKSNEAQTDKGVEDEGKEQYVPLSDSKSLHKEDSGAELTPTNNIRSNHITVRGTPTISQKTKLYLKPTKSKSDELLSTLFLE